jgi:CBS domain-containing protein
MRLQHFMTRDIESVDAVTSLEDTLQQMRARQVKFLPVHLEGGLVGVVTARDIETRAILQGLNLSEATVAEVMTANLLTCQEEDSAERALELMHEHEVRRLLVVDNEQHVVGVVSFSDLALPAAVNSLIQTDKLPIISFPLSQLQQKEYSQ